jgi:thioredoxin-related protein
MKKGENSRMKRFLNLILVFCIAGMAVTCSENKRSDYQLVTKFDPNRDAAKDLELAIAEAQISNRNILLDVGGEWCIWCHKLDQFFEDNPDVNEFLHKNYVVLKINYSPENKNEAFLSQYPEIPGYPHFFVLDQNGKFLHSQGTGDLEEGGGHDKKKVFQFLKRRATR